MQVLSHCRPREDLRARDTLYDAPEAQSLEQKTNEEQIYREAEKRNELARLTQLNLIVNQNCPVDEDCSANR